MGRTPPASLGEALGRFQLSEILRLDLFAALLGGLGAGLLAYFSPQTLDDVVSVAMELVGVVIGAVLAGAAILGSFLDQGFLRKLKMIGREPVHYLAPFLFTATIGVLAAIATLILAGLPDATPRLWVTVTAVVSGTFLIWTLASVFYDLDMLVQFIGMQVDATDVEDDTDVPALHPERSRREPRR